MEETFLVYFISWRLLEAPRPKHLFQWVTPLFQLISWIERREVLLMNGLSLLKETCPLGVVGRAEILLVLIHLANENLLHCIGLLVDLVLISFYH